MVKKGGTSPVKAKLKYETLKKRKIFIEQKCAPIDALTERYKENEKLCSLLRALLTIGGEVKERCTTKKTGLRKNCSHTFCHQVDKIEAKVIQNDKRGEDSWTELVKDLFAKQNGLSISVNTLSTESLDVTNTLMMGWNHQKWAEGLKIWSDVSEPIKEQITAPKPDGYIGLPIFSGPNLHKFEYNPYVENFALPRLLKIMAEGLRPNPFTDAAQLQGELKEVTNMERMMCYPWLIIEVKKCTATPTGIEKCYCQAANGAATALAILANLTRVPGSKGPKINEFLPVVSLTFIGPYAKVWIAQIQNQELEDSPTLNPIYTYKMECIWEARLNDLHQVAQLSIIIENIHQWGTNTFRSRVSSYLDRWYVYLTEREKPENCTPTKNTNKRQSLPRSGSDPLPGVTITPAEKAEKSKRQAVSTNGKPGPKPKLWDKDATGSHPPPQQLTLNSALLQQQRQQQRQGRRHAVSDGYNMQTLWSELSSNPETLGLTESKDNRRHSPRLSRTSNSASSYKEIDSSDSDDGEDDEDEEDYEGDEGDYVGNYVCESEDELTSPPTPTPLSRTLPIRPRQTRSSASDGKGRR